jgi:F-type H+-transporting ATPase subunit delta
LREDSIAKRYAGALVKSVKDEREYQGIKKELEEFQNLLEVNVQFKAGMETLLFSKNQKRDVLDTINKKIKFKEKTFNFILSLVDENRVMVLDTILRLMEDLWFEKNGIERLKVYSAVALSAKLEKQLKKKLEDSFNKKIVIDKEIDPSLIAGIKIRRGLIFYDFSIEGNLKKLKDALLTDIDVNASAGEH